MKFFAGQHLKISSIKPPQKVTNRQTSNKNRPTKPTKIKDNQVYIIDNQKINQF